MTKEEKAEEYLKCEFACGDYDRENKKCIFKNKCEKYKIYLDGLSEGKPKWHDLRKDPNDLPNRNLPVYVQFADGDNYVAKYIDIRWSDKSCWVDQYDSTDYIHDVIAWCELPKFEEK